MFALFVGFWFCFLWLCGLMLFVGCLGCSVCCVIGLICFRLRLICFGLLGFDLVWFVG